LTMDDMIERGAQGVYVVVPLGMGKALDLRKESRGPLAVDQLNPASAGVTRDGIGQIGRASCRERV
jgi:hypothetical protein